MRIFVAVFLKIAIITQILMTSSLNVLGFAMERDTAMQFEAIIEKNDIPLYLAKGCPSFDKNQFNSPRAANIVHQINKQLVDGNFYIFGKDVAKDNDGVSKLYWEMTPYLYDSDSILVKITTNTIWLGNLVKIHFEKQKFMNCFNWGAFPQRPEEYNQVEKVNYYLEYLNDEKARTPISSLQEFKFPPQYRPTDHLVLGTDLFEGAKSLGEVDKILSNSLYETGFIQTGAGGGGYYKFPKNNFKGFVIMTKVEQYEEKDGSSKLPPYRFNHIIDYGDFNLISYLRHIIKAKKGYFRLFVFVVNPQVEVVQSQPRDRRSEFGYGEARRVFESGYWVLPDTISMQPYNIPEKRNNSNIFVLVYEFECIENEKVARFIDESKSKFGLRYHLEKSGIWESLIRNSSK